jgi:HlyD family secretion protein
MVVLTSCARSANSKLDLWQLRRRLPRNLLLFSTALLLFGCSFGEQAPAPAPFSAPTYAPGELTASATPAQNVATPIPAADAGTGRPVSTTGQPAYSGEVLAESTVPLVAEVGGMLLEFNIEVGDIVQAGDLLARVDSTTLEAQRAQALASLEAAQAQVDLLKLSAEEADVEAARAAVAAAESSYRRALDGPTQEELVMAEAQLRQAEAAVKRAQAAYDQVSWNPLIAALPESLQLEQATLGLESAQAQYDKLIIGATADVIAGAYAQVASARAQLERLQEGAKPAQIQAAEAQVRQAETALYLAQLQLDKAFIRSPISGIVSKVNSAVGSMLAPGTPIAVIRSREVKIEISVEEFRLSGLQPGQQATLRVNAYPDRVFDATIAIIAPELNSATRTVQVTLRPTGDTMLLAPGMFATVELIDFAPAN